MKEPHERASGDDRDDGLKAVRDAARAGRISGIDADHRIQQIKAARTIGELDIHTRDLRDVPPPAPPRFQPPAGRPAGPPPVTPPESSAGMPREGRPPGPGRTVPPPDYRPGLPTRQQMHPGARFGRPGRPPLRKSPASPLRIAVIVFIGVMAVAILVPLAIALLSVFALSAVDDGDGRSPGSEPSPSHSSVLTP
ncbi:hypothetical protein BJ980_001787 [Nocardioides daedukensis]|uniref:DUF1707 domain-containing protein n=1 Tax=Nocardioides daedukensis TaxID=634462 RepID=A0A7Y9S0T0_9ACTN|nr:hypothetical protein [Nocardioides daedukensis]